MVKSVIVTLSVDIPETELNTQATITIGPNTYTGTVTAIVAHTIPTIRATTVTIQAPGLVVVP